MALGTFTAEIHNGTSWVNLNDTVNFRVAGEFREQSQVQHRKITATSVIVEGEYTVHSVRANVTETVNIWVHGATQADVTTNLVNLETWFTQNSYQLRFRFGNSRETWDCFVADYIIGRNQVFSHSVMAAFSAQVPRLPAVTYEVV